MEVGEDHLVRAQLRELLRRRLLDLAHELSPLVHLVGRRADLRAGTGVLVVLVRGVATGARFDEDGMTSAHDLNDARRDQCDAVLLGFGFGDGADDHAPGPRRSPTFSTSCAAIFLPPSAWARLITMLPPTTAISIWSSIVATTVPGSSEGDPGR